MTRDRAGRGMATKAAAKGAGERDFGELGVRFVIGGAKYPLRGLGQATLFELRQVRIETGVGLAELERRMTRMGEIDQAEIMDDPDLMQAWAVQIWLARRPFEPGLSVEAAVSDFPLLALEIEVAPGPAGDEDEGSESDPT